ncbi:hypothetical protein EYM_03965 [Ignicoccus islandicus DSM 13165]|uniref:Uncharacterized protein n=1 Tax=Ignicoccus islandicus DSM 13165 TaxID=940295 RepID=A0A0U3FRI1_9CREN|nr:hypothetical protein [Ignicoccus islandicus]ALU12455.1 hypothetical protein EYM_03965 [Ignicoccus islandicus DSM 13165]
MNSINVLLCPRCKIPMTLNIESTISRDSIKVMYSYKCKNCGYRIDDAMVLIKKKDGNLELIATEIKS